MEVYIRAFVNYKRDNLARYLPMAEFAYNIAEHVSTGYTLFELKCGYHSRVPYKEDVNPRSKSKAADELTEKLGNLMAVCRENL